MMYTLLSVVHIKFNLIKTHAYIYFISLSVSHVQYTHTRTDAHTSEHRAPLCMYTFIRIFAVIFHSTP